MAKHLGIGAVLGGDYFMLLMAMHDGALAGCGCTLRRIQSGGVLFYQCPKHAAAPRLYQALVAARDFILAATGEDAEGPHPIVDACNTAIAKAEGAL
jgi:hypothetical protein